MVVSIWLVRFVSLFSLKIFSSSIGVFLMTTGSTSDEHDGRS